MKDFSHKNLYNKHVFAQHKKLGWVSSQSDFKSYTSIRPVVDGIKSPLYVVFPLDDPVLSNPYYYGANMLDNPIDKVQGILSPIKEDLSYLQKNNKIKVFTPKRGGHLGYFLDQNWLSKSVLTFFKKTYADIEIKKKSKK